MKWSWIVALAWLPALGMAQVSPSEDFGLLAHYPDARLVEETSLDNEERLYPVGAVRRIAGRLRMDGEVAVRGNLRGQTYRLPENHRGLEAFTRLRTDLVAGGGELLYWCEGRECGASNLWANEIFGQSRLYGPENQQGYLLVRLNGGTADSLVAMYAITRGNGRSYLHVEQMQAGRSLEEILPTPATLLRQLRDTDLLQFERLGAVRADWLQVLTRTLQQDSTLRVSLSGQAAPLWYEALIGQGVRTWKLELDEGDEPGLRIRRLR